MKKPVMTPDEARAVLKSPRWHALKTVRMATKIAREADERVDQSQADDASADNAND